ncbi:hypothetical protein ACH4UT_27860 [Streptomyces sp. NPDC020799]|uniref:hypothetical protein n=1 Tax=Streptomyces sp. NPDC020799 TaxID=3365091 RepID=UPI0037A06163
MTTWHLNSDQPLYTRHPEPREWTSAYGVLAFDDATLRRSIAVHEAGHAVLNFAFGIPVEEIRLFEDLGKGAGERPAAWVRTAGQWSVPYVRYVAMCAAGERALDRWMRETGLWSPERAWVAERSATDDRKCVVETLRTHMNRAVTFGGRIPGALDYATVQAAADAALARLWGRVLRLAAAVDEHGVLTGRQAAGHARMTHLAIPCDASGAVAA